MGITKIEILSEWAADRLKIMEYSFEGHDKIRKLFKKEMSEHELEIAYKRAKEELYEKGHEPLSRRNTAYYVWGHLKNLVTKQEKKRIFGLLENLDGGTNGYADVKREFYKLALKYDVRSVIESRYFDEVTAIN